MRSLRFRTEPGFRAVRPKASPGNGESPAADEAEYRLTWVELSRIASAAAAVTGWFHICGCLLHGVQILNLIPLTGSSRGRD